MATRTPEQIAAFRNRLDAFWQRAGNRRTQVRDILGEVIAQQTAPFEAEELLAAARKIDRQISLASVYRTLSALAEGKLLRALPGARETKCYMLVEEQNDGTTTIVCTDCEQVVPMSDQCLPLREGFLARQLGFNPTKMSLRIEASCEEHRRHGDCPRRTKK